MRLGFQNLRFDGGFHATGLVGLNVNVPNFSSGGGQFSAGPKGIDRVHFGGRRQQQRLYFR